MQTDTPLQVGTPLYLVLSTAQCWKCGSGQEVVGLATWALRREGEMDTFGQPETGSPFMLSMIREMPPAVQEHLTAANPRFKKHFSKTADVAYFANLCQCGANFGDFYLFKPDGAFFPTEVEDACGVRIVKLPLEGVFEFQCDWSQGGGQLIFEHGQRV